MKSDRLTIALRFADTFAPAEGTIQAHQDVINRLGFVWYGKLGSKVSLKVAKNILSNEIPRILLIHSGKTGRYWAYTEEIRFDIPPKNEIPSYYRENAHKFKTWFKIIKIEEAPKTILRDCMVISSHKPLSEASKYSMSPYFIISEERE